MLQQDITTMKTNKKLNSKGFSHIEMILAVVVIVAIAGVGIFVYKHHQDSKKAMASITSKPIIGSPTKGSAVSVNGSSLGSLVPSASALNLSHLDTAGFGWDIYACQTSFPNGTINIQAYFWKPAQVAGEGQMQEDAPAGVYNYQTKTATAFFDNRVAELTMNVKASNTIRYIAFIDGLNNGKGTGQEILETNFTIPNVQKYIVGC